uniref:RING-type domain-containing protein n=1 Tax=Peronospora matthiolae TaxID=2874970 RepID=A0AAV1UM63_9STRA
MDRNEVDTERRLRAMEIAFEHERQQHEVLEKKYARLKRRYVRLERSHSRLVMKSREKNYNAIDVPAVQSETSSSSEAVPSSHMSPFAVIDLTSPRPGSDSATRCNDAPQSGNSGGLRDSRSARLSREDFCGESPSSLLGSPRPSADEVCTSEDQEEQKAEEREAEEESVERTSRRRNMNTLFSTLTSRRRLHLDFALPSGLPDSNRVVPSPLRRMQQQDLQLDRRVRLYGSPQARFTTTGRGEHRTRTRPRLRSYDRSPERTATFAYGLESEQEVEPRTHHHELPIPSVSSPVVNSSLVPTTPSFLPLATSSSVSRPGAQSDEEASLALARYLQQQENIAAYEEHEARLLQASAGQVYNQRSREHFGSVVSGILNHQRNIDPDNMTYEELLRLGEEVGDVKQERWRQIAVQVISGLPTHQWTDSHGEKHTCIVCQYNFMPNDRAMTLPCAHVFHEDCVDSWIRENNSCPLCKREISSM